MIQFSFIFFGCGVTSKQKLANRNEKSQGEFQKKDETKRVPQAQEIDIRVK